MKSGSIPHAMQAVGVNAVPIVGLFFGDWSTATALIVYWSETLIATLLTAARIALHRRVTRKSGHYRDQWERSTRGATERAQLAQRFQTFLSGFLAGALSLTIALGLFLALLLGTVLDGSTNRSDVVSGVLWMALAQSAGFGWDLIGIRERPFAWIRAAAHDVLGRVVLIQLGMLVGMFVLAWIGHPPAFFGAFAAMKLGVDILALLVPDSDWTHPDEPPKWASWIFTKIKPDGSIQLAWQEHLAIERARRKEDEEVYDSPPGPSG